MKGTTHHQFKGAQKGKKGGHEAEEHEGGKYAGQKSGYTSYGEKQGKFNKSAHKKKQGEHKVEKKAKKHKKKKVQCTYSLHRIIYKFKRVCEPLMWYSFSTGL